MLGELTPQLTTLLSADFKYEWLFFFFYLLV